MSEFLAIAFGVPTIFFTVLLVLVVVYWITVLLGAVDLDLLDGAFDLDIDIDAPDLEVPDLEVGDVGDVANADLDIEAGDPGDLDASDSSGGLAGLIKMLGLSGVPLTISLSLLVLFGWILSYVVSDLMGGAAGWLSLLVAAISTGAALALTSLSIRPLRPVFRIQSAPGHRDLVGQVCIVTTGRVDTAFGQAEVANPEGAPILVQVRCPDSDNGLGRGSKALIFDYDARRQVFLVSPLDPDLAALDPATGRAR